ncbi:hypothetical protein [Streptomyces sp. NPDC055681]
MLFSTRISADGAVVIDLLVAAIYLTVAAAQWHENRGHEQQAASAEQTLRHLRTAYDNAAQPTLAELTRRAPHQKNADRYETAVRQALPEYADRILTDRAWPALTTVLARAESGGHRPVRVLAEAAAKRELGSTQSAAEVLSWRISNQPNRRAQAAMARVGAGRVTAMLAKAARPLKDAARRRPRR